MKSARASPFESQLVREQPETFLSRVRDESCYKTLRALITLLAGCLAGVGLVLVAVAIKALGSLPGGQDGAAVEIWTVHWRVNFLGALGVLLAGLFAMVLAVAFRQAAFLLADIADILIHRGRTSGTSAKRMNLKAAE